ncbi:hypothetical protein WJX72_000935 [[Myrmecia] bisecta]|uniref:Uncharacterized protein n=1 Tax=[Myrmecia] bisecta TaxID=41462 RepID=A0AAW1PS30_9CHLO
MYLSFGVFSPAETKLSQQGAIRQPWNMGSHFLLACGCLLRANGTAIAIALALMHTAYYMPWRTPSPPTTLCAQRRWIADNLTPDFEEVLWRFEVMFAHGPDPRANATWLEGMKQGVFSDVDKQLILMALCDEVDEHFASEGWWSKNWKMRSLEFQDALLQLASQLAPPWLAGTMEFWFGVTNSMFKLGDLQHHAHPESEVSKMVNKMMQLK